MSDRSGLTAGRVLIVDDDPAVLELLANVLRTAQFEVSTSESGDQALELCKTEQFELALVDARMPGMDGCDLAVRLLEQFDVPSYFISADCSTPQVQRAIKAGAIGYATKSMETGALLAALRAGIEQARTLRRSREQVKDIDAAIKTNRDVSLAVGIIMVRLHLEREAAFEAIRRFARRRRERLTAVASRVVELSESLDCLLAEIAGPEYGAVRH